MNELKAFFKASVQNTAHIAIYRLPSEKLIEGYASQKLTEISNDSEGFIIGPFDTDQKPRLIEKDIYFSNLNAKVLEVIDINDFSRKLLQDFQINLRKEGSYLSAYHNPGLKEFPDKSNFITIVNNARKEIKNNLLTKVVLSRPSKFKVNKNKDLIDLFINLCDKYPNAFVSLISSPFYGSWLGASPEILLEQRGDNYMTTAIAGTKKSSAKLEFTSKEFDEQHIITEYIENLLKEESIKGEASSVQNLDTGKLTHLQTNILFRKSPQYRLQILAKLHPTPAVGGYPTKEALRFIDKNENYSRELYSGYLGPISKNELKVFVNIRCMQWLPDFAILYAGAGITEASDAEAEWVETENKLQVIASVL
jgi:isochorismate synthase